MLDVDRSKNFEGSHQGLMAEDSIHLVSHSEIFGSWPPSYEADNPFHVHHLLGPG